MTTVSTTGAVAGIGADDAALARSIERLLTAGIGITALAIDQIDHAADLTLPQWRVLVIASGTTHGLRVGELAAHLGVTVPSASRIVRRVESKGLVTATRADHDRRTTIVRATRVGSELVEAVVGRRRELIGLALRDRPRDEDEDPVAMLESLAGRLTRYA
jgi:DNA-binding MarR family transcriptional regulator